MKYIATYENFNYQPTNEEFIGLFSAKTRNEKIKQGFENASKIIEGDKSLQDKIMAAYNTQKEKPSTDEMKDAIDIVSGSDDAQVQSLEKELKSHTEHQLTLEEIGRRAINIRDWNNKRIHLKNIMADKLGCRVKEIKQDHLSQ